MALPSELSRHLGNPVQAPLQGQGTPGYGENAACGDELWFELGPDGALGYRVIGCAALVASASCFVAAVRASSAPRTVEPAQVLAAAGGLPARSAHVLRVIERAWRGALG